MATVYAHTNDGYVARFNQSSWSNARANTAGTTVSSTGTSNTVSISASRQAARGGGYSFHIYRSFLFFDTSGISGDVSEATLKIRGAGFATGDVIAVKSNSDIDNQGNVTFYSAEISTWSTSGYNDITLNSTALANMRDDDKVYICLLNADYDLRDVAPTGYATHRNGLYYTNYTGTSRDPYIDYTLAPTTTDNSVFFGCNF